MLLMNTGGLASSWPITLVLFLLVSGSCASVPAKIDRVKTKDTVHVSAGHRATLECHYEGFPRPEAMWMRDGKKIKPCKDCVIQFGHTTPGVAKLHVTPYRDKDFGEYTCKARNRNGFDSVKIKLVEKPLDETQCRKDLLLGKDPRLRLEFRPRCDADGLYHRVQCSIHLDKCWCVNRRTGHKTGDAYKAKDGMHCTAPTDISTTSITLVSFGAVLVMVALDILAFACCKRGLLHSMLRCKDKFSVYGKLKAKEKALRRLSTIEEGSGEDSDGSN